MLTAQAHTLEAIFAELTRRAVSNMDEVNNSTSSRARESEIKQSKLSGEGNELLPDTRAPAVTGRTDPQMEAVRRIDRPEVGGGEGAS